MNFAPSELELQNLFGDEVKMHKDTGKTIEDICADQGFKLEQYEVETKDGYILSLYRIPGKLNETEETKEDDNPKPVVFFMHGLNEDHMSWMYNKPSVAPAFVTARAGYDVWLGDNRGNRWSTKHKTLSEKSKQFWNFTWE